MILEAILPFHCSQVVDPVEDEGGHQALFPAGDRCWVRDREPADTLQASEGAATWAVRTLEETAPLSGEHLPALPCLGKER